MDNEEPAEFPGQRRGAPDPDNAEFNEYLSKVKSILKRVAADQERIKKLLERSTPGGE